MAYINKITREITAGGGTHTITAIDDSGLVELYDSGAASLSSNWTVDTSGTLDGCSRFKIIYNAPNISFNGNTITIMGVTIPSHLEGKKFEVDAYRNQDNTGWNTIVKTSADEAGTIADTQLVEDYGSIVSTDTSARSTEANTTETDLATSTIAANALSSDGDFVQISAFGVTAANANTKTIRLKINGTEVMLNSTTTAPNNATWSIDGYFYRDSSLQGIFAGKFLINGSAVDHMDISSPIAVTWSSTFDIKITGQNGTASAGDITCSVFHTNLFKV